MKTYAKVDVQIHVFFTSGLFGGEWSASRPGRFIPGERAPGTHSIRGCVGPRTDLDDIILLLLLWLYSPLLGLGRFFSYFIPYTVGIIPWTRDQPVARPLPTHRTTQTQNKRTQYRHPCLEWDSNPRSQRSSERRQFMT
jgi:hypothetical protein